MDAIAPLAVERLPLAPLPPLPPTANNVAVDPNQDEFPAPPVPVEPTPPFPTVTVYVVPGITVRDVFLT